MFFGNLLGNLSHQGQFEEGFRDPPWWSLSLRFFLHEQTQLLVLYQWPCLVASIAKFQLGYWCHFYDSTARPFQPPHPLIFCHHQIWVGCWWCGGQWSFTDRDNQSICRIGCQRSCSIRCWGNAVALLWFRLWLCKGWCCWIWNDFLLVTWDIECRLH